MGGFSLTEIGRSAKMAVIGAIKSTGDTAEAVLEAARDLLLVSVEGVAQVTVAVEKGVAQIVVGAIAAAGETGE